VELARRRRLILYSVSMSDGELSWYWERLPAQLFDRGQFFFIGSRKLSGRINQEVRPFSASKLPLSDTPFFYQLALSNRSVAVEVRDLHFAQPEIPLSGDRRAGVLVFDGEQIVGSLIIQGHIVGEGYKMVVNPKYRQQGLANRLLVEWCWQTKRRRVLPRQGITLLSAKALLSAHKTVVERAVQAGCPVPKQVLGAVALGRESARIVEEASRAEVKAEHP
jgi:hypothetical protein